jgi:hypothetical protein
MRTLSPHYKPFSGNLPAMLLIAQHLWELILFLIVLVGPIPLCLSLAGWNFKENSNSSFAHFLLVIMTGWSSIQLLTGLILGSLDRLNLSAVIIAQLIIFALGILAIEYIKKNTGDRASLQIPQLKQFLNKWELLIIAAATFAGCVLLGTLATKPTTNYDSLWFHLPAIARWYQTGSFTLLDPSGNWMFEHEQARIYPYNWHVLSVLCVMPFREDFLATFPLLIAWVLQGLSIYLVSVKFGANRLYSMAASCLVLTVPMLLNQVNSIHPDLPLAAIFTVSFYFGISYYRSRVASELALFLATAGILAGIKVTGIAYTVALLGGLAILEIARFAANKKLVNSQTAVKTKNVLDNLRTVNFGKFQTQNGANKFVLNFSKLVLLAGIVCLLFFGGFWYARTVMQINYPVSAPAGVQVPLQPVQPPPSPPAEATPQPAPPVGKSVPISSPYLKIWHSTLAGQFNPLSLAHWQTLGVQIIARLQLPFIAIALQILAAILASINSRKRAFGEHNIILIATLAGTGILYLITPYSSGTEGNWSGVISPLLGFNLRYGFPFLSLLGIAAAVAATQLKTRSQIVVAAVMASSFLGIVSNTIFDIIRDSSFTGKSIVWGSLLIDTFKSNPGEAVNILHKSLADSGLELAVYPVVGLGLTLLLVGILSLAIPELSWSIERSRNNLKNLSLAIALVTLILLVASASLVARERRDVARTELYRDIYEYIDKNAAPDERIGFFFSSRSYLFYGKNLNREVLYVPFKSDVLADWLADLRQNKVGMVAIGPLTKTDEPTVKNLFWLTSSQGPLEPVFGQDFLSEPVLYRLK